tara:strand:+ start:1114 stop:1542 length:429 start_codon:yes stop_codon:yes gene_type:complete
MSSSSRDMFSSPRDMSSSPSASSHFLSRQNQTYDTIGITKMPLEQRVLNNEKAELRLCRTSTLPIFRLQSVANARTDDDGINGNIQRLYLERVYGREAGGNFSDGRLCSVHSPVINAWLRDMELTIDIKKNTERDSSFCTVQ